MPELRAGNRQRYPSDDSFFENPAVTAAAVARRAAANKSGFCKRCSAPLVRSIGILPRADDIAVGILIAAIVIMAAVVAVGSRCRGADRRPVSDPAIDASADRGACYRAAGYCTVPIAASRNSISPASNAVTTSMNRSAPEMGGTSAIASTTPVAAAAKAPTCERIVRHKAGAG